MFLACARAPFECFVDDHIFYVDPASRHEAIVAYGECAHKALHGHMFLESSANTQNGKPNTMISTRLRLRAIRPLTICLRFELMPIPDLGYDAAARVVLFAD